VNRWPRLSHVPPPQRLGLFTLGAGLALVAAARLVAGPGSPPLYDGVVSQEPYRFLNPTSGHAGNPTSFHTSLKIEAGRSPQFVAATAEIPPQAQLIAGPGAFSLSAGTSSLDVSIAPTPTPPASGGQVTGNVYRLIVKDQAGASLAVDPASPLTLVLRAPEGIVDATIVRLDAGGSQQPIRTQPSGQSGIFIANVTQLGDYALILPAAPGFFGLDPLIVGVAAIAGLVSALALLVLVWQRRARPKANRASTDNRAARPVSDTRRRRDRRRRGPRR
jgi:hypothetical protein